jgi:hypothetical protein
MYPIEVISPVSICWEATMLKVIAFLAAIVTATSSYAQEVRVIGGGVEHVYGPGGQLRDSPELRAKNQQMREDQQRTIHRRDEPQAETRKSWQDQVHQQLPKPPLPASE